MRSHPAALITVTTSPRRRMTQARQTSVTSNQNERPRDHLKAGQPGKQTVRTKREDSARSKVKTSW
jgi:hypothetical protein